MTTVTLKHFDALDYVEKAEKLGIPNEIAKFQARAIEHVVDAQNQVIQEQQVEIDALKAREPATKRDLKELELILKKDLEITKLELQKEISNGNNKTVIWIFGMMVIFSSAIMSVVAKGFHWW